MNTQASRQSVPATRAIADTLVDLIEREAREGDLLPGHFVGTKKELLERFGVAPATLGEAIRVLRNRGVITVKPGPGGGIFLAAQSPITRLGHSLIQLEATDASVEDCLGITDSLDQEVVRDAVRYRTAQDAADLAAMLVELERVWGDTDLAQPLNWRLHKRIAEITPNRILSIVYTNVVDYILTHLDGVPNAPGFSSTSEDRLDVHRRLVQGIVDQDLDTALDAVRDHRTVLSRK
ncbi:FCD domain-containing protein [Leucobacter rhizosphaerae]|uniref:FCD domain-containing protein n=1 Tax=Leucobacter rhizosphaerae TaxID=2932245 RepID=A0ABY4FTD9_9MICO|nr:FCD domain-containing protein [Leucobacter rhizosphaerae]UOQ59570.1 FCD domain-containing protein [Leucobacter rhizosphaerae]